MRAGQLTKRSTIVMILAMTAGTFACGGDDDDNSAASETTKPAVTSAAPTQTTEAPTTVAPATTAPATTEPESATSEVSATTAPPPDPCEPMGVLTPGDYLVNDRCVGPEDAWAKALVDEGAWGAECPNAPGEEGLPTESVLAVPNQLIVVIDTDLDLTEQVNGVIGVLGENSITADPGAPLIPPDSEFPARAQMVEISSGPDVGVVLDLLDDLQGAGRSVDLNYLEPVQPNNGFRPVDDPEPTTEAMPTDDAPAGALTVAVIDSTDDQSIFDIDGNRMIDEDHGHGQFVTSIIASYGVTATLIPVGPSSGNPSVRGQGGAGTGRWAPMAFEDQDIISALALVDPQTDVINMSLGGVGCTASASGIGIGERLALAHAMSNMRLQKDSLQFVAAAGNNGRDVLHFPAAWRNANAMSNIADAIEPNDADAAADVRAMSEILRVAMYAVGSVEAGDNEGQRSGFSNCGDWVNAAAHGSKQVGLYPSSQPPTTNPDAGGFPDSGAGNAKWSGTSFATANFTAALATGRVNTNNPAVFDPSTGARVTDSATGLAC
jgi:hypothetical protein